MVRNKTKKSYRYYECGTGWYPIIDEAVAKIEDMGLEIAQIKEKFGGLRIYLRSYSEEAEAVIDVATDQCSRTCETCGKPGELYDNRGWLRTLCSDCAKEGGWVLLRNE